MVSMVGLTGVAQNAELCCSESAFEPERKQEAGMPQRGNGEGGPFQGPTWPAIQPPKTFWRRLR